MVVTPAGMVMLVRAAAFSKAPLPMVVSALSASKDTVASNVHPEKALLPMVVTPAGMVMIVKAVALSKT